MSFIFTRREFLELSVATAALAHNKKLCFEKDTSIEDIFPTIPPCKELFVGDIRSLHLDERMMFLVFQGVMNKKHPHIYLISTKHCNDWLDYYSKRYGIPITRSNSCYSLMEENLNQLCGYRLYDPQNLHTFNLASTMAGFDNIVPVHPMHETKLKEVGLRKQDDLRGKFKDRYDAYQWGMINLLPQCAKRVAANLCMDRPHWPSSVVHAIDFFVQAGALQVDFSSSRAHPRDVRMLHEIYETVRETRLCNRLALRARYGT